MQTELNKLHKLILDGDLSQAAELADELSAKAGQCLHQIAEPAAPLVGQQEVQADIISGAVFDFAGYLTTLPSKEAIHCSTAHDAAPMVDAITDWAKKRGLATEHARVETWHEAIAAQAKQGEQA